MVTPTALLAHLSLHRKVSVVACTLTATLFAIEMTLPPVVRAQIAVSPTLLLTCELGMETASYKPGLKNTEQQTDVYIDGFVSGCVNMSENPITSGTYSFKLRDQFSCNEIGALQVYTIEYNWNTKESSAARFTSSQIVRGIGQTVVQSSGTIIKGRFEGKPVMRTVTLPTAELAKCNTPEGLTTLTGSQTLTVMSN